ncbi:hypothetical protein Syun_018549 [Stephania yunnanensis]|uniref:Cationic amino acid transporter C-terminal domain-containing protein n=1 Tax=Stephania yunnanensis TaxID=152371 RepID=A0AAP0IUD2_9MAGN
MAVKVCVSGCKVMGVVGWLGWKALEDFSHHLVDILTHICVFVDGDGVFLRNRVLFNDLLLQRSNGFSIARIDNLFTSARNPYASLGHSLCVNSSLVGLGSDLGLYQSLQHSSFKEWQAQDFFPSQSFTSWPHYSSALSQTLPRLKDRLLHRSSPSEETQVKSHSEHPLKRCLSWWDLIWLSVGSVVGTGIFVLTGQEAHNNAGPSIVISYAISGLSALLSALCYAEFAVSVPVAGGSFSFLRIELGDFTAFVAASNILLEAVVGAAGIARSWTSYFATIIGNNPNSFRIHVPSFSDGFNMLDPIAVLVLIVTSSIPILSTVNASRVNWITSAVSIILMLFITVAGFVKGRVENLSPFFPYGAGGMFRAAGVLFWAYTGFDMVATMAEEAKDPPRDIPVGLVGSMSLITVLYCAMALSLSYLQSYSKIDVNAAYAVAFDNVGMKWAKYVVALGAIKGMTTGLIVGTLGQGRYTTQIARTHMIPPFFGLVHPRTGTPINATILVSGASAVIALFSSLDVLSSVSSLSTLFIFMLMAVALLSKRYNVKDVAANTDLIKLVSFTIVIIGAAIGSTAYYQKNPNGWLGHAIALPIWFIGTLGIAVFVPQHKAPGVFLVPFVPWLPSLSIGINIFLIGSLGYMAFVRFAICTSVMLLYYLFVSLHATYDMAHENQQCIEDGSHSSNVKLQSSS